MNISTCDFGSLGVGGISADFIYSAIFQYADVTYNVFCVITDCFHWNDKINNISCNS